MEIILLNAQHGVLLIEDAILRQQWLQDQWEHIQVIPVISKGIHFITYYRRDGILAETGARMEELWLQLVHMIMPIVDSNHTKPKPTGSPNMVIYTNPSKVRLLGFRNRQTRHGNTSSD